MADTSRQGIFIVEDEGMVSMLLEEIVAELGYEVVDTAATLRDALRKASVTTAAAAILDVNLNGENSMPVAAELARRGIPYVFATGYGQGPTEHFSKVRVLPKPFAMGDLDRALSGLLS